MLNKVIHSATLTAIVILAIMLMAKTKQLNMEVSKNIASAGSIKSMKKELQFNQDTIAALQLKNGRLIILAKDKSGNVVPQSPYVPPEGGVKVRVDVTGTTTGQPKVIIDVNNKGFAFKPGIGVVYSSKLYPEIDMKLAYWDRYSIKAGTTIDFVDVAATRHVDDLLPWFRLQNIEIQFGMGLNYADMVKRFILGIRANL